MVSMLVAAQAGAGDVRDGMLLISTIILVLHRSSHEPAGIRG